MTPKSILTNSESASDTLQALAEPIMFDDNDYGCGPLLEPQREFYVTMTGDDQNDGLTPASAWQTLRRALPELTAGDTLWLDEGEYIEPQLEINVRFAQSGEPGKPIRIMALPEKVVIVSGAPRLSDFTRAPKWRYLWATACPYPEFTTLWESLRDIELQAVPDAATADELPGSYWHDRTNQRLYIHFSDSRAAELNGGVRIMPVTSLAAKTKFTQSYTEGAGKLGQPRDVPHALRIHGNYIHLQGIWFKHHRESVVISANASYRSGEPLSNLNRPLGGQHNTIENCRFSANEYSGVLLTVGAEYNLIRSNTFAATGFRGALFTHSANDNLIKSNLVHVKLPTKRAQTWLSGAVFGNYAGGKRPAARNHLIDNLVIGNGQMQWKPVAQGSTVQGNVFAGINCTGSSRLTPTNRVTVRNNILGTLNWENSPARNSLDDWIEPDQVFINNLIGKTENARFADPAWSDYRLQSDSPLLTQGKSGFNRGKIPLQTTSVYYVNTDGNDDHHGKSSLLPLRTFKKATSLLQPGDTLYIMPGIYTEELLVTQSGDADSPISFKAYGKKYVELAGVQIKGKHIELAGVTVLGAVKIQAPCIALNECVVLNAEIGIHVDNAPNFTLRRSSVIGCARGLVIENYSTDAVVRESLFADSQREHIAITEDSRPGYLAGQNYYDPNGIKAKNASKEFASVIARPIFENPYAGDYRLRWDSPLTFIALDGNPPGALGSAPRMPIVADISIASLWSDAVLVHWATPFDDTNCRLEVRPEGTETWQEANSPDQGTIHGAGITGLRPETRYESRITAYGRRGGEGRSETFFFTTPATSDEMPARVFYVSPEGDDAASGLTADKAWRTLRKACFTAGPRDQVMAAPGTYYHALAPLLGGSVSNPVTFHAIKPGEATIDGQNFFAPLIRLKGKSCIVIDGFNFSRPASESRAGLVSLDKSHHIKIINCRMEAMPRDVGILVGVNSCHDLNLEHNLFWGGAYHLRFDRACRQIIIKNNTFVRCNIYHCVITSGTDGIRFLNNIFYLPCSPKKNNARFYLRGDVKNFTSDYNLFYSPHQHQTTIGLFQTVTLKTILSARNLSEWQKATGHDTHSLYADPLFVSGTDNHGKVDGNFHLLPGSPATGKGKNGVHIGAFGFAPSQAKKN